VFVLAASGLLNGRKATTHWRYIETLKARYPDIDVVEDVLYQDEGDILTSAGSAAGIDLCLHVVRRDLAWKPPTAWRAGWSFPLTGMDLSRNS
jgi:AraC family transcriptional activator FtrA